MLTALHMTPLYPALIAAALAVTPAAHVQKHAKLPTDPCVVIAEIGTRTRHRARQARAHDPCDSIWSRLQKPPPPDPRGARGAFGVPLEFYDQYPPPFQGFYLSVVNGNCPAPAIDHAFKGFIAAGDPAEGQKALRRCWLAFLPRA
jgi:hypothetical protein